MTIPQGFRRAPRSSSTDLAFFVTAALAGGTLAIIASVAPYVAAVLLVVRP
jgi:hypothetical protein